MFLNATVLPLLRAPSDDRSQVALPSRVGASLGTRAFKAQFKHSSGCGRSSRFSEGLCQGFL